MLKICARKLFFIVAVAWATEYTLSFAPVLAHTPWEYGTQLYPEASWSYGRYQLGGHLQWLMAPKPYVFTLLQANFGLNTKAILDSTTYTFSTKEYLVAAGFRHKYNAFETRLWWGLSVRHTDLPLDDAIQTYNLVGPSWGVSYGMYSSNLPISWYWGVMITPGYYNFARSPQLQIPTRTQSFFACEWHIN